MKQRGAKLGQHFLRSSAAVSAMIDAAHITEDSIVLEIGPGEGVLTKELLLHAKRVIAIEKDSSLVLRLRETFAEEIQEGKLLLIEGDIRDIDVDEVTGRAARMDAIREGEEPLAKRTLMYGDRDGDEADQEARLAGGSYVVAANIPYYITGEIIRTLLTSSAQPKHIALLIQREVATRIVARDKKESILSLSVKAYGNPRIARIVPRGSFTPSPSVDSAIIAIENISRDFFTDMDEERFFEIVHAGFSSKRKMLAGNLKAVASAEQITNALDSCGIAANIRAEDVALEKWRCLAQMLN